jgi:hypothetical protein
VVKPAVSLLAGDDDLEEAGECGPRVGLVDRTLGVGDQLADGGPKCLGGECDAGWRARGRAARWSGAPLPRLLGGAVGRSK